MKNLRKLFFCTSLCMAFAFGLFIADANSQASIPPATEIGGGNGGGSRVRCYMNVTQLDGSTAAVCVSPSYCRILENYTGSILTDCL